MGGRGVGRKRHGKGKEKPHRIGFVGEERSRLWNRLSNNSFNQDSSSFQKVQSHS